MGLDHEPSRIRTQADSSPDGRGWRSQSRDFFPIYFISSLLRFTHCTMKTKTRSAFTLVELSGRHRDHRYSGGPITASRSGCARGRQAHAVHQPLETVVVGLLELRVCLQIFSTWSNRSGHRRISLELSCFGPAVSRTSQSVQLDRLTKIRTAINDRYVTDAKIPLCLCPSDPIA